MPYEPKPGHVSVFENEKMGRENAPDHSGYIIAHRDIKAGEKIAIHLWLGKPNSSRSFSGQVSDMQTRTADVPLDLFGNPVTPVR